MKFRIKSPSRGVRRQRKSGYRVAQNSLTTNSTDHLTDSLVVDLNKGRFEPSSSGAAGIEDLKITLRNPTEGQLEQFVAGVGRLDPEAAIPVIETLSYHKNADVRKRIAASLGEFEYLDIVDTLMRLLMDRSPEVRREATASLGRFAVTDTLPLLRRMSHDKSGSVRLAVLKALSNFGEEALPQVISVTSHLLLDPKPVNAVTAFQTIKNFEFSNVSEHANALINGVVRFYPTLATACAQVAAPADIASFPTKNAERLYERRAEVLCNREWMSVEQDAGPTGPPQLPKLESVIKLEDKKASGKGPRHLIGWWAGMQHDGKFTEGKPHFISSRPGYLYKFRAAISTGDIPGDYAVREEIDLGEGATAVAVALVTDNDYLEIEGDRVKEIQVPAEGDSTVAEFSIRGVKVGETKLEVLVYHKGCLTLRAVTATISVRHVNGSVSDKIDVPATATVMSNSEDVTTQAKQRLASLLIAPPMSPDPGKNELLFALFYQEPGGYHFEAVRVPAERAAVDRQFVREGLTKLMRQRKGLFGFFQSVFVRDDFILKIDPKDADKGMRTLRGIGLRLWSDIFEGFDGLTSIRKQLRSLLQTANQTSILQIVSSHIFLPWQLLYLNDGKEEPDSNQFWGMRLQTEQTLALGVGLKSSPQQQATEPISAYLNANLPKDTLAMHRTILSGIRNKEVDLVNDLKRPDNRSPALYLYCHAQYDPTDKQQSWIELTNDRNRITLERLRVLTRSDPLTDKQIEFKSAPLVFLNACHSGDMDSGLYESFVGFMLRDKKAGGVLGTETRMPAYFATVLAVEFWKRAKSNPATVSQILFDLRRDYWNQYNNPLGFLYSLYTHGDFTVA